MVKRINSINFLSWICRFDIEEDEETQLNFASVDQTQIRDTFRSSPPPQDKYQEGKIHFHVLVLKTPSTASFMYSIFISYKNSFKFNLLVPSFTDSMFWSQYMPSYLFLLCEE